jgi:hypothetical protein
VHLLNTSLEHYCHTNPFGTTSLFPFLYHSNIKEEALMVTALDSIFMGVAKLRRFLEYTKSTQKKHFRLLIKMDNNKFISFRNK